MSVRVQCPSCGRSLLAREAVLGSRGTCPSCLAEIAVPETVQAPEAVQPDRSERQERGASCPRCGRDVEAVWVSCPWCEEPLSGRPDRRYGRPDIDVRRDQKGTSCSLIALAVLGGIGVVFMGFQAAVALNQGYYQPLITLVVGLLFLAGLTTIIVFVRSRGNPGASGWRRVVVGTLALVGTLTASVLALLVFLFVVCIAAIAGLSHH